MAATSTTLASEPRANGPFAEAGVWGLVLTLLTRAVQPMRDFLQQYEPWDWDDEDPLLDRPARAEATALDLWS